jgi:hypothetical protein
MKTSLGFTIGLALWGAFLFPACQMDPSGPQEQDQEQRQGQESKPAVTYTAAADGVNNTTDSNVITFTFSEAVTGLTAEHISFTSGSDKVTKGQLSGSGDAWTLGITVISAGNVKVKITKTGIEAAEKAVTLFKSGEQIDIDYTAAANGGGAAASTAITFTFGAAVTGLTAEDITFTTGSNKVTKGTLSGSGQIWSLGITVQTAGEVKVKISKTGIEDDEKTLTVSTARELNPPIEFANKTYSSNTQSASGDTAQWILTANDQGKAYFGVYKEAAQTITVSGTDAARVSQALSGIVDGITATDTLPVFTVETGDLAFDGGTRTFTLNVNEPGGSPRTVNITLNVQPNETGAAVFKLVKKEGDVEFLERVDIGTPPEGTTHFIHAFKWVESNAQANTEYTLRVEQDETNLPQFWVGLNQAEGAALRLKGTKGGPWKLEQEFITNNKQSTLAAVNLSGITSSYGFFQIGNSSVTNARALITFILGKNITIQSGDAYGTKGYTSVFGVGAGGTLVLEPGSAIQDHVTQSAQGLLRVVGKTNNTDPHHHGRIRILGGSITNCSLSSSSPRGLIYFGVTLTNLAADSFYLAPNSGLFLNGNSMGTATAADAVVFGSSSPTIYTLSNYLVTGASWPVP